MCHIIVNHNVKWEFSGCSNQRITKHWIIHNLVMYSKCLALMAQMIRAFGMNPMVRGSSPPSGRDIFCLKNFDNFIRTSVPRAQLTFEMFTSLRILQTMISCPSRLARTGSPFHLQYHSNWIMILITFLLTETQGTKSLPIGFTKM